MANAKRKIITRTECPDCGRLVSLKAKACPRCACPLDATPDGANHGCGCLAILAVAIGGAITLSTMMDRFKRRDDVAVAARPFAPPPTPPKPVVEPTPEPAPEEPPAETASVPKEEPRFDPALVESVNAAVEKARKAAETFRTPSFRAKILRETLDRELAPIVEKHGLTPDDVAELLSGHDLGDRPKEE